MKKIRSNYKEKFGFMFAMFLSGMAGGLLGIFLLNENEHGLMGIIYVFLLFYLSFLLHIILHEGGHLIFGLITNYDLISFRIGTLTFVKYNGRINRKKFKIKGTAGQCLMMPKADNYEEQPFLLYNLGGLIANLVIILIAIAIFIIFRGNKYIEEESIALIITGIFVLLTNGIPMNIGGIANDAYNIISLIRDKKMRYCLYIQLKANGLNSIGTRFKDLPVDWFEIPQGLSINNPMVSTLKIMEANYYHDKHDFTKASECYQYLLDNAENLIKLHQCEIKCEMLFYEIVGLKRTEIINNLYDKDLKAYIKSTDCYISRKRLMYAYELLYKKDMKAEEKLLKDIDKCIGTYPSKGEIFSEVEIVNMVKSLAENDLKV